jgi:putative flavoprotein involved in K+ transport
MTTTTGSSREHVDTVVVGGGQAGLVTAYELKKGGKDVVVLDAHARVGDAWRTRWDSLRLFTPRRDCALPGLRMAGDKDRMPSKDEMADYLEQYAVHHALDVRSGVRVSRLSQENGRFLLQTSIGELTANDVVVASGSYGEPVIPAFATDLDNHVVQLHSSAYRNQAQLQSGDVLLVGAGNSGSDIALDVVETHGTWLAGPKVSHVPPPIDAWLGRMIVARGVRFVQRNVLCLRTPIGRRKAAALRGATTPVIRVKPKWLERAGVQRVGRVVGVHDGLPQLEDGRTLDVTNVIWCTGFRHDFPWIDLIAFDDEGTPLHTRGVSTAVPGLYFVGLPFQFALASPSLWGVARDAAYVARQLVARRNEDPARVAA